MKIWIKFSKQAQEFARGSLLSVDEEFAHNVNHREGATDTNSTH